MRKRCANADAPNVCKGVVGAWTHAFNFVVRMVFVSFLLESGGLGCWRLGPRPLFQTSTHVRSSVPTRFSEHHHVLSKISGHEMDDLVVTP